MQNNPINLIDRYGFKHEEFIQQYSTKWPGSIDAYVAEVERLHLTHPEYAKAKEREQKEKELEEIINSFDVTEEEKGYLKRSLGQLVEGNYTEDVTLLGTAGQVGTGLIGVDLPGDVRDLIYDVTNWKWNWGHAGQTSLDAIALLPILGVLKYTDEATALIKGGTKAEDTLTALAKKTNWGNLKTLDIHFAEHGADFGAKNAEDYAQQASDFLRKAQAEGLPTKVAPDGTIRVYDSKTNTFGSYNPDGTTKSFFKPTSPDYWQRRSGEFGLDPLIF